MDKKTLVVAGVVALAVSLLVSAFRSSPPVSTVERVVREVIGAAPGPLHTELQEFEGGVKYGNVLSTSTPASMTLRVGDIRERDSIIWTPTGAEAAKTITFFASSSAATWLPKEGERQETCVYNASTTAGVNLVFVAGTGIDLETATSTEHVAGAPALTIGPGDTGCFNFMRLDRTSSAFDISASLIKYNEAD